MVHVNMVTRVNPMAHTTATMGLPELDNLAGICCSLM